MYMVFGLPNSAEQCIRRSPFGLVERGAEGGLGESDSAATGQKSAGFVDKSAGHEDGADDGPNRRRRGRNRPDSTGNRPLLPINRPSATAGQAADRIGRFCR
jgi:hypothetical protein